MKRVLLTLTRPIAATSPLLQTALLLCSAGVCQAQEPIAITFDGPPAQPPGTQYGMTQYSEAGMVFTAINPSSSFTRNGGGVPIYPNNGTPYLQTTIGETLAFSPSDSSAVFGLSSVQLAEYSGYLPDFDIQFIGYRADGTTVTAEFTGGGPLFQNYYFDSSFSDLTRVEIPTSAWSLDNLVITVPEPGVVGLLGLGAVVVAALRRKRRTSAELGVRNAE